MSQEPSPVRTRQRPRRLQVEEVKHLPPPTAEEEAEYMLPSEGDGYEFRNDPLPESVPARIRRLAKNSHGAAREEVMRWMAPFILQRSPSTQIAEIFDISISTVARWKKQYRETVRREIVGKSPIEHFTEATDRIEVYRRWLFGQLTAANPGVNKVHVAKALIDLEKTQLLLNTGYGAAGQSTLEIARNEQGGIETPEQMLLSVMKDFAGEFSDMRDMDKDELASILEEMQEEKNAVGR